MSPKLDISAECKLLDIANLTQVPIDEFSALREQMAFHCSGRCQGVGSRGTLYAPFGSVDATLENRRSIPAREKSAEASGSLLVMGEWS